MKEFENDKMLKDLLKEIKLEKPGDKFTTNVMNKVFDIAAAARLQTAKLHILGWKFWILVSLFVALAVVLVILTQVGVQPDASANSLLPSLDSGKVGSEYHTILDSFNKVPVSIVAILLASSTLIFIERFLSKKKISS
jgi:hypothetical protein